MTFEAPRLIRSDCSRLLRFLPSLPNPLDFFCVLLQTHHTNHPFKLAATLIKKKEKKKKRCFTISTAVTAAHTPEVCSYCVSSYNSSALSTQHRDLNRFKRAFRNLHSVYQPVASCASLHAVHTVLQTNTAPPAHARAAPKGGPQIKAKC